MRSLPMLLVLAALTTTAEGQTGATDGPIIEGRTPGCYVSCAFLTNRNMTSRVVVTLVATPDQPWPMYDRFGNSVMLTQTTIPVLLQAGERRTLADQILVEAKLPPDPITKLVTISYRIAGFYIPKPDLKDLPAGTAEDFARFYVQWQHYLDGTPACGVGQLGKVLRVRNMNYYRALAVTYRNLRPGTGNAVQTVYLQPGEESPVGCQNDWPVLTVSNVRFAS